jgi:hypothetical protein
MTTTRALTSKCQSTTTWISIKFLSIKFFNFLRHRQGKRNVRRTHPVGSGNIYIVREHEAEKEKEAAEKEVRGKTRAGNRATAVTKKLEAAEKGKKNYEEKISVISEKLKSKDNKTLRRSLTNAVLQKNKAEKAIEKLHEEQIDIQYTH